MRFLICVIFLFSLETSVLSQQPRPRRFRPFDVQAEVFNHVDGDTFEFHLRDANGDRTDEKLLVRLDGVDAIEPDQPLGDRSHNRATALLHPESTLRITSLDESGRATAYVFSEGVNVNVQMIKDGLAWHDIRFNRDPELAEAQLEAMRSRRGLWRQATSIPPWVWRDERQRAVTSPFDAAAVAAPAPGPGPGDPAEKESLPVEIEKHPYGGSFDVKDCSLTDANELIGTIHNSTGQDFDTAVFTISIYSAGGRLSDVVKISTTTFRNKTTRAFKEKTSGLPKGGKLVFRCDEQVPY